MTDSPTIVPEQVCKLPQDLGVGEEKMTALEQLESKCAQLCRPVSEEEYEQQDFFSVSENAQSGSKASISTGLESDRNPTSEDGEVRKVCQSETPAKDSSEGLNGEEEEEEEVDFYSAPSKAGVRRGRTHSYSQLQDYVDYISGHHDNQPVEALDAAEREESKNQLERERREWTKDYALRYVHGSGLGVD